MIRSRLITVDDVIEDIKRNGSDEAQLMSTAFLDITHPESREAYIFGHWGSAAYYAKGNLFSEIPILDNRRKVILVSIHKPGSPEKPWLWPCEPSRILKIQTRYDASPHLTLYSPRLTLYFSDKARVYEDRKGALEYSSDENCSVEKYLLKQAIENVKTKKE